MLPVTTTKRRVRYIQPGLAGSQACSLSNSPCHLLQKGKWLSPQYQRCTFSPIHFFLSASLGQPGAGHAASHSALPEPMLPSLLCQRRQESTVFTSKCFGGENKNTLGFASQVIHLVAIVPALHLFIPVSTPIKLAYKSIS